jgi:hypothetical protein
VESTTAAEFRAKNLFREEVRSEITQTQLDDRHDIDGNTIYRLAFDATIIAGTKSDSVAGIKVTLGHYPHGLAEQGGSSDKITPSVLSLSPSWSNNSAKEREQEERRALNRMYNEDYERLYLDWIRYMQGEVANSVTNISAQILSGSPDPLVRLLNNRFLIERICQLKIRVESLSQEAAPCDPDRFSEDPVQRAKASANRNAALKFINDDLKNYFVAMDFVSTKIFVQRLRSILSRDQNYKDSELELTRHYQTARYFCQQDNRVLFDIPDVLPAAAALLGPQESKKMPCPFYDSPAQRLAAGILLYEELIKLDEEMRNSGTAVSTLSNEIDSRRDCKARTLTGDPVLCGYLNQKVATRCFAADFIKANLNSFGTGPRRAKPWRNIDYFLRLDVIGRENGDCHLQVSPLLINGSESMVLRELTYLLNERTEAFAYSIAPKNFTENISTASETRDTFELLVRYGLPGEERSAFVNDLRRRSNELRAVLAHPIVVGFGSGRRELRTLTHPIDETRSTAVIRETDFGWVVAPRMRGSEFEQIDNQYALTAVISVPSWWRSVELDIKTCWLSRPELSELQAGEDVNICKDKEARLHKTVIRLPGAIAELSRKLGFEVLQEPYLSPDNPIQVLEIGQPGSLLLKGGRLWRSTEVTIGSQKADSIVVLPNMNGIIAHFKCVLPQLGIQGYDKPIQTAALVWTSEGVTTGAPVTLNWPSVQGPISAAKPQDTAVPDEKRNASSKESAGAVDVSQITAGSNSEAKAPGTTSGGSGIIAGAKLQSKWCPEPPRAN